MYSAIKYVHPRINLYCNNHQSGTAHQLGERL